VRNVAARSARARNGAFSSIVQTITDLRIAK
jgi:hypothetical protein